MAVKIKDKDGCISELHEENAKLREEVRALRRRLGMPGYKCESCPFCDSPERYMIDDLQDNDGYYCVGCKYCGCRGPSRETIKGAVDCWNNRKPAQNLPKTTQEKG